VALALGALVLGAPFLALACALVKLEDGGPVLFRQARCGRDGRRFTLLKLRTMVPGAERYHALLAPLNEMKGPAFKMTRDPRVLRVGRWLRRFSIDEIPQLLNVLAGDMALVGPRPALPEEVTRYEPWQRRRLTVKPGLTGLSQVEGRGASTCGTSTTGRPCSTSASCCGRCPPSCGATARAEVRPARPEGRGRGQG
jgi:lipopolysaccharide/colanic/teichoic acid biosynthesis glycosyltransferase